MKTLLRRLGTILLFATVAICFAPTIVPIFLDRIYYRGPEGPHFEAGRFFNPGQAAAEARSGGPMRYFGRFLSGRGRRAWPGRVPVVPTIPPRRVDGDEMLVTWIGHSTVLIQTAGLNILTDPIWSETASPFPPIGPDRVRAPGVRFEDQPRIDLVLVSHNHYDHLDLPTLKRLWARGRPAIVTSLGNDSILEAEGIEAVAGDWGDRLGIAPGCPANAECRDSPLVRIERVQHWSSRRGTDRNRALWSGFTIETEAGNIFFAGDTGYGDGSWVKEAALHGPFRLAILPVGAYAPRDVMERNHMDPDEAVAAFEGLGAGRALGVHWGTFQLTFEPIGDPPRRLAAALAARGTAPDRFVTTEPGRSFFVPRPAPAEGERAAGSGSARESPGSPSRRLRIRTGSGRSSAPRSPPRPRG
ncbi:MAG TPA: MBL fold metallo-hydrolase [Allosphingosinicella sp.]|nr:MBL fold metallo-hydrolase [Allosphingosinicella sp.]